MFVVNEDAGDSDFHDSSFSAPTLGRTTNAQPKLMVVLRCYAVAGAPEVQLGQVQPIASLGAGGLGVCTAVGLLHEARQDLIELVRYELRDVVVAANDDVASPTQGADLRSGRLECRIPAPCDDEKRHLFLSKFAQLFSKRFLRRELQLHDRLSHARPLFGAGEVSDRGRNADECAEAGGAIRW